MENKNQIKAFKDDGVFNKQSKQVKKKASCAEIIIKETETSTPMMKMDYASLNTFLNEIYGKIKPEFMDAIEQELSKR